MNPIHTLFWLSQAICRSLYMFLEFEISRVVHGKLYNVLPLTQFCISLILRQT